MSDTVMYIFIRLINDFLNKYLMVRFYFTSTPGADLQPDVDPCWGGKENRKQVRPERIPLL